MAKDCSFDIVSEFDRQELVNAIEQTKKDIQSRFDLKDSNSSVELESDKTITITTNDDMKLKNIVDILQSKMIKRNLSIKILDPKTPENALGGNIRQIFELKKGFKVKEDRLSLGSPQKRFAAPFSIISHISSGKFSD